MQLAASLACCLVSLVPAFSSTLHIHHWFPVGRVPSSLVLFLRSRLAAWAHRALSIHHADPAASLDSKIVGDVSCLLEPASFAFAQASSDSQSFGSAVNHQYPIFLVNSFMNSRVASLAEVAAFVELADHNSLGQI